MTEPEPDFRAWGKRLLAAPRGAAFFSVPVPETRDSRRRRAITAVIEHPDTPLAERQAAISALERLDRRSAS